MVNDFTLVLFGREMDRKNIIQQLRPEIPKAEVLERTTDIERFQNVVLRPILKFQHEILKSIIEAYLTKLGKNTTDWDLPAKELFLEKVLRNDAVVRNTLCGVVIGLMTTEEVQTYYSHEQEMRRRTCRMIVQRLIHVI